MNNEPKIPLIFDGHNDVLLKLYRAGGPEAAKLFLSGCDGHIDLVRAKIGGLGGGFFAIYVPSPLDMDSQWNQMTQPKYDLSLPKQIHQTEALPVALNQASILFELENLGCLKICRTVTEIRDCLISGKMAAILHMEGAEAIDPDFHALTLFYKAGLRSIGPVWSRPTLFGHGVPFRYPSDGNTGPGLTNHGLRLVDHCNKLGIVIDLSHMNEAGFWDVAKRSH